MNYSFVYTSVHCRRWRSRMEVKIMAGSLFVHCKIAYFYSVTAEKWLIVSLPNFVTIRRTHFSISCKIFSWIRWTKLKIHVRFYKGFCKSKWFICTLLTDRNEHVAAKADSSLSNRRASLSRSLATGLSVDSRMAAHISQKNVHVFLKATNTKRRLYLAQEEQEQEKKTLTILNI